jgi:hypothetical protein
VIRDRKVSSIVINAIWLDFVLSQIGAGKIFREFEHVGIRTGVGDAARNDKENKIATPSFERFPESTKDGRLECDGERPRPLRESHPH